MKKLGVILALFAAIAASPAMAHGFGGGHGFHGGRSVGHGFGGRGGWRGGAALGGLGIAGAYGASQCYQWDGYQWVWVCPSW
jgi:hypothetical protein